MKQIIELDQGKLGEYLLISDVHLDNPKCNRKLLKRHLDQALAKKAKVLINGDLFCAMQGNKDRRASKADIMVRHLGVNYFDLIIEDAVEFFAPYKDILCMVGYGNHETAIIKHNETDILSRFVHTFNERFKANVQLGGYGGWIKIRCCRSKTNVKIFVIKFIHGWGGGGPVTKSLIHDNRIKVRTEGADLIWKGHIHEYVLTATISERFNPHTNQVDLCNTWQLSTPTYKEEHGDGTKGFHTERGRPPKPLGGAWLRLELNRHTHQSLESSYDYLRVEASIIATDMM